uniref:Uncharacterized protein n=1 Tax=Anguilla anguilla TaxID=7936 RepID=A0A0E9UH22_ANGAN
MHSVGFSGVKSHLHSPYAHSLISLLHLCYRLFISPVKQSVDKFYWLMWVTFICQSLTVCQG